ncbi:TetR-like C-terminal domain-containing protein [Cellulomonas sp.]|uniref:TetR-like C-terminal domain-containing protein n=1 Tax=Cellulomonas sp. TaxID=40001 RepID=UPI003BAC211E
MSGLAQTDPELDAALFEHYAVPRRERAAEVIRCAQERGQMRIDAHPQLVVDQLWGACHHRPLILTTVSRSSSHPHSWTTSCEL